MAQLISDYVYIRTVHCHSTYVLCDIDGCISNDADRTYIDDYDTYHSLSPHDKPYHSNLFRLAWHHSSGIGMVLTTARPIKYMDITKEWLARNYLDYDMLFMRPEGCTLTSPQLKNGMAHLFKYVAREHNGYDVDVGCIYDDRSDVLEYLTAHGWNAVQMDANTNTCRNWRY